MKQGMLNLRIESFSLQQLFDIVEKGKTSFPNEGHQARGEADRCCFESRPCPDALHDQYDSRQRQEVYSAGGEVVVEAQVKAEDKYVEISITDNGKGMDEEQLSHVFDRAYTGGHGFGLINCKGIIEKYKKTSRMFDKCDISVQSGVGKGSRFAFSLPVGRMLLLSLLIALFSCLPSGSAWAKMQKSHGSHHLHKRTAVQKPLNLQRADQYADSAYFSNVNGHYERTLAFADSAREYLNRHYLSIRPKGTFLMVKYPEVGSHS